MILDQLGQGLTLSGIGILITFSALAVLILIIVVLKALFPAAALEKPVREEGTSFQGSPRDRAQLRKQAAAVGVAVLLERAGSGREGDLGSTLEKDPGAWWRKGLDRIHRKESS